MNITTGMLREVKHARADARKAGLGPTSFELRLLRGHLNLLKTQPDMLPTARATLQRAKKQLVADVAEVPAIRSNRYAEEGGKYVIDSDDEHVIYSGVTREEKLVKAAIRLLCAVGGMGTALMNLEGKESVANAFIYGGVVLAILYGIAVLVEMKFLSMRHYTAHKLNKMVGKTERELNALFSRLDGMLGGTNPG